MVCVRCGCNNPPGANFCLRCKMALPKIVQEMYDDFERQSGRLERIIDLTDLVREGQMEVADFTEEIAAIIKELSEKAREIMEIVEENNYGVHSPEEVEVGFEGIDAYEQGLALLLLYGDQMDPICLDRGIELIEEGNTKINEAMRLNRDRRTNLEWDVWV
ncbi:MAG: hypothetical protein M1269_06620 [Chloroflexi bacterium]|nr:hypothetical protein [Chloroflexota bacterium]